MRFSCNMDLSKKHQCDPKYDVFQIDNEEGTISPGFNYRETRYNDDFNERDLIKRWGIRIIFVIDGEAGKFSMIAALVTIGAGLSFFASKLTTMHFFEKYFVSFLVATMVVINLSKVYNLGTNLI